MVILQWCLFKVKGSVHSIKFHGVAYPTPLVGQNEKKQHPTFKSEFICAMLRIRDNTETSNEVLKLEQI
jgi:hypothetical protein